MKKLDNILSNFLCVPIILMLGFWGWAYNIDVYIIPFLAVYTLAVFVFCKDVKNILPIIFSVPFFISSVDGGKIKILAISLAIFVVGTIYYTVKQFITQKDINEIKEGRKAFSKDEWITILLRSTGMEADKFSE